MSTDVHHLAAAYALDAVDDTERAVFESHYPACDVCRVDVDEFRATLAVVASAHAAPPGEQVKERVMADISRTRQLSPRVRDDLAQRRALRGRPGVVSLLAAAAAVGLLLAGLTLGRTIGTRETGYADAAAAVLGEQDVQFTDLDGTVPGTFRVAWSAQAGQAVVLADGLGAPGDGHAYELWLIDDAGPHAMDLLDPAEGGDVRRVLSVGGQPAAWGVTIEPDTGSDAPTTDVIFSGAV